LNWFVIYISSVKTKNRARKKITEARRVGGAPRLILIFENLSEFVRTQSTEKIEFLGEI